MAQAYDENGQPVEVIDGFDEQGRRVRRARSRAQSAAPSQPRANRNRFDLGDIGSSAVAGLQRGFASLGGMGGDLRDALRAGYSVAGVPGDVADFSARIAAGVLIPGAGYSANTADNLRGVESVAGPIHEPETVAGEYARTIGEFAPGALAPGGVLARTARVVIPGVATETAGQVARTVAPESEGAVRFGASLLSGVGTEALVGRAPYAQNSNVANGIVRELRDAGASADEARDILELFRRNAPRAEIEAALTASGAGGVGRAPPYERMPNVRNQAGIGIADDAILQAERDFMPLTTGERAGNAAAIQRENNLRRRGYEPAQGLLQDHDEVRAGLLAENAMRRIGTKGDAPLTIDSTDAGNLFVDELRDAMDAMDTQAGVFYDNAFRLADTVPMPPSDELPTLVATFVDENFFRNADSAVSVVNDLAERLKRGGGGTYRDVERARQELNRLLGQAMANQDGSQVIAVRGIIDIIDDYASRHLVGEAREALMNARAFYGEMQHWFGEQARPTLSTGHRGRRDLGGRRVQSLLYDDVEGDHALDLVFGSGTRGSRVSRATTGRIAERERSTIRSEGAAVTGAEGQSQRVPGRTAIRPGATAGSAEFRSPNRPTRGATRALQEAYVHRLLQPLRNRADGDALPIGQLVARIEQALGPGRATLEQIFNPHQIAELERLLLLLRRAKPRAGSYSPSGPSIAQDAADRSISAAIAALLQKIPGGEPIGNAIERGIVNRRAIEDARAAVAPYKPPPPPVDLSRRTNRPGTEIAIAGALGANNALHGDDEDDAPRLGALGETEDQRWARRQLEAMGAAP